MDEPTTGMDPKTRRGVWQMIKDLKKNRSVILTTHAMEEAEVLADRIAVISEGQVRCIGTSLYLKNNYGDGYRLTLVTEPANVEQVRLQIRKVIPSCRVVDQSGGSILISVPVAEISQLKAFFSIMENKDNSEEAKEFRGFVLDWGLQHSSLEEVFMQITKDTSFTHRLAEH